MEGTFTDVLQECIDIANERQKGYDDPIVSMQIACDILEKTFRIGLTVEQMCYVLVALKFSRQHKEYNKDNIIDSINYLAIAQDARNKLN